MKPMHEMGRDFAKEQEKKKDMVKAAEENPGIFKNVSDKVLGYMKPGEKEVKRKSPAQIGRERAKVFAEKARSLFEGLGRKAESKTLWVRNTWDSIKGKVVKPLKHLSKMGVDAGYALAFAPAETAEKVATKAKVEAKHITSRTKAKAEKIGKKIDDSLEKVVTGYINGMEKGVDKSAEIIEKTNKKIAAEAKKLKIKVIQGNIAKLMIMREEFARNIGNKKLENAKKAEAKTEKRIEKIVKAATAVVDILIKKLGKIESFQEVQKKKMIDAESWKNVIADAKKKVEGAI